MAWFGVRAIGDDEKLTPDQRRRVVRRTIRLLRPYRRGVAAAMLLMLGSTACLLAGPALIRHGIDRGLRGADAGALDAAALGYLSTAIAAFFLGRAQIRVVAGVGEAFLRDLRVRVFDHLQSLSMSFFDREQTGRLVARMTSDIDALSELVQMGLVMFVTNALLLVLSIVVIVVLSPLLAVVAMAALPVVIFASIKFRRSSNRAYLVVRDRVAQTLSSLQEGLSGVRIVQAFAREDVEASRFAGHNDAQLEANLHAVRISSLYFPVVDFTGVATTAAVVGIGGVLVHQGRVTVGTVAAFVLYLSNLFEPVQHLSQLFNTLQSAGAALSKLFGLLDTPSEIRERPGAVDLALSGSIEVDGVSFEYRPGRPILTDVGLTVVPGERIALVGPTGAGKSTLAKLVARLYDPTQGSVRFGGVDLRDATLSSLRERIVVVPQEGHLFSGTIRDNVRVARIDATDDEVDEALRTIGVHAHFAAMPDGLDTAVRERGTRLSAGERQLVSLARAALADPAVLVLDEATSSLDPGTEAEVEAAMGSLMQGRTVVVIAHRLSTAERADRVAVVLDGRLAEVGTHEQLLGRDGHYTALFGSWAAGTPSAAG